MTDKTDIVVIGGGYAGVTAANRMLKRDDVAITLINPRPTFVERIRLHQLVGRTWNPAVDYAKVLNPDIRLVVDTVARIDAADHRLVLAGGETIDYDYLIYAVGSRSGERRVPGAAEFGYSIATFEDAQRLKSALETAPADAAVTVVGAGATGIETASELAEAGSSVTLICGGVLGPYLHPKVRRAVAKKLAELGVTVLDGPDTLVTAVTRVAVQLNSGRRLPSDVTVWTTGFSVPELARSSGLSTDAVGRLLTDETLTSVDDPSIVAAGDVAAPSGQPLRMSCQAAGVMGAQAAETVLSRIAGERPLAVNQGFVGMCVSLGRHSGVFQFARRDDSANRFYIGGGLAAKAKEIVCLQTVAGLTREARRPGATFWLKNGKRNQRIRDERASSPALVGDAPQPSMTESWS